MCRVGMLTAKVSGGSGAHEAPAESPLPAPVVSRWKVGFTPSRELADRGVTIDAIRARISERGDIESAMPRMHAGGGVYFEFIVQLKPGESPPSGALTSSVTAGGGKVSGHTTGGNSVTVHSGDGTSSSSVTTSSSGNGGSTTVTSANGDCTIYVNPGKKK